VREAMSFGAFGSTRNHDDDDDDEKLIMKYSILEKLDELNEHLAQPIPCVLCDTFIRPFGGDIYAVNESKHPDSRWAKPLHDGRCCIKCYFEMVLPAIIAEYKATGEVPFGVKI
jgi:hypothetical protein